MDNTVFPERMEYLKRVVGPSESFIGLLNECKPIMNGDSLGSWNWVLEPNYSLVLRIHLSLLLVIFLGIFQNP